MQETDVSLCECLWKYLFGCQRTDLSKRVRGLGFWAGIGDWFVPVGIRGLCFLQVQEIGFFLGMSVGVGFFNRCRAIISFQVLRTDLSLQVYLGVFRQVQGVIV